jgi:hypothetical protein
LLATVDVERGAGECGIDHDVNSEPRNIVGLDVPPDGRLARSSVRSRRYVSASS